MPHALALEKMVAATAASRELAILPSAGSQDAAPQWQRMARIGEGASSVVWQARHRETAQTAALKIAKNEPAAGAAVAREALLLARVARRWGPSLIAAGPGFVATEWLDGEVLAPLALECRGRAGERLVATVAHGVSRALEELHEAGVRHGDVKPANVVLSRRGTRERDAADDRGATLIDLGLATSAGEESLGATPRYAAPELRERGESGPATDLWALGIVLAELLDPGVASSPDPRGAMASWGSAESEPARWAQALVAFAPGGRPSAAWLAARAARWLGLRSDPEEGSLARAARVRRTYLAERGREVAAGAAVSRAIEEPARGWLETVISWQGKLTRPGGAGRTIEPLGAVRRARWLVSLVGPSAAAWPLGEEGGVGEGDLARRAVQLARDGEPSSWTLDDLRGRGVVHPTAWRPGEGADRIASLVRELARPAPDEAALAVAEDEIGAGRAPVTVALQLASSLLRSGETGRAWAALATVQGEEAEALRAEIARRRGDVEEAERAARRALGAIDESIRSKAKATLARLSWDAGRLDEAEQHLQGARGAAAAEVAALVAYRRGTYESAILDIQGVLAAAHDGDSHARLEAVLGLLELARGSAASAQRAFRRAVELAARSGAVVDEATYLTSEAAAASDVGDIGRALASATRAMLLWERLGRPANAARAWLARAGSLAAIGAAHATDEAAEEACARSLESRDERAVAYARWAQVEVRPAGDAQARAWAIEADSRLRESGLEDRARAAARLLVWASDDIDEVRIAGVDAVAATFGPAARWEWWGARAASIVAGRRSEGDAVVLGAIVALIDVAAPLASRGPALDAAVRLATAQGDGEAARRLEHARGSAARALRAGTPDELETGLVSVGWARPSTVAAADVSFVPAQVAQLESIVRALSGRDRLRPLLEQVLDTLILWTGVERGLLLLRAPDGRLVPRAARNLAGRDLVGDQLALSQTIARRAAECGDAVVATDAFSTLGDVHASVHALGLRSVLAVPLIARGETLGVVYLDDRIRKGAFGPSELAWVRVVASQAAMAIGDARDAVLLRRAVRRSERARGRIEAMLREREAELDVTRTQLDLARDGRETRNRYDEIAGRSEPMRELLRLVDRVTASDVPVLILGESGTGKELVARAIHVNGPRSRRTFVGENCASLPETLLESTLFGHVKGAFTGASSTRAGLFDVADGGTLFLDEIGEMPLAMQAKLLRVLQDGEIRAVGGDRVRKVDVRVIGATHRDLEAMVAARTLREDLFYRLNVITVRVPPLRERTEDIPLLVEHFLRKHSSGREVTVTRGALAKLVAFPWPGNVRQLENEVRRALVLADGRIDTSELSSDVIRGTSGTPPGSALDMRSRVGALEAELVNAALAKTRGNQTSAAKLLGMSRFGLQKMMRRLNIKLPA